MFDKINIKKLIGIVYYVLCFIILTRDTTLIPLDPPPPHHTHTLRHNSHVLSIFYVITSILLPVFIFIVLI